MYHPPQKKIHNSIPKTPPLLKGQYLPTFPAKFQTAPARKGLSFKRPRL